jgi:hypothetical protein
MNDEPRDLLPQWRSRPAPADRPRGLLDELIGEGVLTKDFAMPGHTFRVSTKIHCDPRACLFRCAVSCDGVELPKPPWAPVFRDLAPEMGGSQAEPETRREVARRALEVHLATCARVGQALERGGRLVASGERARKLLLIAGPAVLLAAATAAGWHYWPKAGLEPTPAPAPGPEPNTGPPEAGESEATAEIPLGPPEAEPEPATAAVTQQSPAPDVARAPSGDRRSTPRSRPHPAQAEPAVEGAPPQPAPSQQAIADPEPPPSPPPERSWPVTMLAPIEHTVVRLEPGNQVFVSAGISLVDVPSAYRGLHCITTRDASGETKRAIVIRLSEPAQVYVAHDVRVKKRPGWLESFEPTGDALTVADRGRGEVLTYALHRKLFPAGVADLGANTGATVMGRVSRSVSGRNTLMYLVCVPESGENGSPAAEVP